MINLDCGDCDCAEECKRGNTCKKYVRANKPLFEERYFGYDADVWRAKLLKRLGTTEKLRRVGLD